MTPTDGPIARTGGPAAGAEDPAGPAAADRPLGGRKLWVPQMGHGASVAFAAAFRSAGIDAEVCPSSDARTLELGSRLTSGEECLPARVTLGGFLKVTEQPGFDPDRTAFFMPSADGPCRFGQYAPYIGHVLRDLGLGQVSVFAPSSRDGYGAMGIETTSLMRTALRGLVAADLLRKMLHRTRPYELQKGETDAAYSRAVAAVERVLEQRGVPVDAQLAQLEAALTAARDDLRAVEVSRSERRVFIGVVGEIFCRLATFANESTIRRIEELGGECVLAPIVEWVWYTNLEHQKRLRQQGRRFSKAMLTAKISDFIQRRDEHRLARVFEADLRGTEEPPIRKVLELSQPYLPHAGSLGEMTLSVGKAVYHYHQGCDAVVDISPFSCMNGIVTEAVYPRVSADLDEMPIRNFYFDGTRANLARDLGVLMELARSYQARKKIRRVIPDPLPRGRTTPGAGSRGVQAIED